jgi:mannose/fructose/N-acetylgalactosamine-specific phosphotransferase system component IIC
MTFYFAHYWGIDEVGVFVIPAVLAVLALRWAEKRAKKRATEGDDRETASVD